MECGTCLRKLALLTGGRKFQIRYHRRENLYKVGGSLKRLKQAETKLWEGQVDEAIATFSNCHRKQGHNFCAYLTKHSHRLVNYQLFQQQRFSSIRSEAFESAVKLSWSQTENFGGAVEMGKCLQNIAIALCLPQWFTSCLSFQRRYFWKKLSVCLQLDYHSRHSVIGDRILVFLQNWDAPTSLCRPNQGKRRPFCGVGVLFHCC